MFCILGFSHSLEYLFCDCGFYVVFVTMKYNFPGTSGVRRTIGTIYREDGVVSVKGVHVSSCMIIVFFFSWSMC